ncbi:RNB domain-containing ribonuclease [Peptacetobacter hiranonis]|uniref:RNB domain-containing ribonuclease n=1 Tax=Peptacetobacter hiranonis TaxID=89152 RepID=UPI002434A889|nr:RNB domain-containing ribonuclease [Peptacetobacter hiranonis]
MCESVIASHLRTNYDDVSDIIENKDKKLIEQYKDFIQDFEEADKLAQILRDRRMKRGIYDCRQ